MPEIPISQQMSSARIAIGWPRTLFALTVVLVILVSTAQLLIASYSRVLLARSAQLERDIQDLAGIVPAGDLERLVKLDRQIRNLRLLLNNHVYLSRFLDELERVTLPQVRYFIVNVHRLNSVATLRGSAPSMEAVSMQAAAFSQSPSVTAVTVKSANISAAGGITFDIDVAFDRALVRPYAQ